MTKTKRRKKNRVNRPMTFKQHLAQLRKDIFDAAFDPDICGFMTVNELANQAGLAHETVRRMYERETVEPRHSTIHKLCRAIGMDYNLVKEAAANTRG